MRRICAWCGKDLGVRERTEPLPVGKPSIETVESHPGSPESSRHPGVKATICRLCAARLVAYRSPVIVVSHEWIRLYAEVVELLRARPDIQVVLDRRHPTGGAGEDPGWDGPERRRRGQRWVLK